MTRVCSVDLHIHGNYSGGTSDRMVFDTIADEASRKGLEFVGSGDILHPGWLESMREELRRVDEGTFEHPEKKTKFVPTVEVEDGLGVHHLILLPSLSKAEELREKFEPHSSDINIEGRPHLDLEAPEIVDLSSDSGCLIGPAHAFTPWTSIFKEHDSLRECYEDQLKNVDFLELGLSADTSMADRIRELNDFVFLSNSDAHSPWPNKLGREFNRLELPEFNSSSLFDSIQNKGEISLNAGLHPKLGKYHLTACSSCHRKFSLSEADSSDWKCSKCGGEIKKGVSDRVDELSDFDSPRSPDFRPDYLHMIPLSEVIALAWGRSDTRSSDVQKTWSRLVESLGDEVTVLVDTPVSEIGEVSDESVASVIRYFRSRDLNINPGGGGEYGRPKYSSEAVKDKKENEQKTLKEFGE